MKYLYILFILNFLLIGCTDSGDSSPSGTVNTDSKWTVSKNDISGSLNPFPLAKDPIMIKAKDIDFIFDNARVALVNFGNETRVYPYQFISEFEAINDKLNDIEFTMTYCPNTKSGLVMDRKFKIDNFIIRASGYLYQDNQVLIDESSDTFWSQMLVKCIKGKYAGEHLNTFNFVETVWSTVKEHFPEALVFTKTSIINKASNPNLKKNDLVKGELMFGVIDLKLNQNESAHLFHFDDFIGNTKLKTVRISSEEILVIGNEEKHFITSYINDSQSKFKAVQDQFPIIMEDTNNNKWNIFGVAVSGPRKGEQLKSLPSLFALGWVWESFYSDIIFDN